MNRKNFSTKIKTSTTFPTRSLCKFCCSGPVFYSFYKNEKMYKSPDLCFKNKTIYNVNYDHNDAIIKCRHASIQEHSFILDLNKFNIKMHRTKGVNNKNNYEEFLFCDCGKTGWKFNYKSTKDRKEISMRQSKKFFNKEFSY
jgi:hypothetical protein